MLLLLAQVTDLLEYCTELSSQDPGSCHGRLVQDICLELPSLKTSHFSQIKQAVMEEAKVYLPHYTHTLDLDRFNCNFFATLLQWAQRIENFKVIHLYRYRKINFIESLLSILTSILLQATEQRKQSKVHNCYQAETPRVEAAECQLLPRAEEILEMTDLEPVTEYKLERLVNLLRLSRRTVVFTRSPHTKDKHYGTQCGIR